MSKCYQFELSYDTFKRIGIIADSEEEARNFLLKSLELGNITLEDLNLEYYVPDYADINNDISVCHEIYSTKNGEKYE